MKKSLLVCIFHCLLLLNVSSIRSANRTNILGQKDTSFLNDDTFSQFSVEKHFQPHTDFPDFKARLPSNNSKKILKVLDQLEEELQEREREQNLELGNRFDLIEEARNIIADKNNIIDGKNGIIEGQNGIIEGQKTELAMRSAAEDVALLATADLLLTPLIGKAVSSDCIASTVSTTIVTAAREIYPIYNNGNSHTNSQTQIMKGGKQIFANAAIDGTCQCVGMQAGSAVIHILEKTITIKPSNATCLGIKKFAGHVLAATVGTALKQELSKGYFQRQ